MIALAVALVLIGSVADLGSTFTSLMVILLIVVVGFDMVAAVRRCGR